jgi:hypothetical protein
MAIKVRCGGAWGLGQGLVSSGPWPHGRAPLLPHGPGLLSLCPALPDGMGAVHVPY